MLHAPRGRIDVSTQLSLRVPPVSGIINIGERGWRDVGGDFGASTWLTTWRQELGDRTKKCLNTVTDCPKHLLEDAPKQRHRVEPIPVRQV